MRMFVRSLGALVVSVLLAGVGFSTRAEAKRSERERKVGSAMGVSAETDSGASSGAGPQAVRKPVRAIGAGIDRMAWVLVGWGPHLYHAQREGSCASRGLQAGWAASRACHLHRRTTTPICVDSTRSGR